MQLLVGVDLSDSTEAVVRTTEKIARALSAKVWLLHVAEPDPDFVGFEVGPQSIRDSISKEFRGEHSRVQEIAGRLRGGGLDTTALLVQGATADTILEEAAKLDVDMIVIGSHGRGAVHHLLVGSVSETVLRKSECPILVVPTTCPQVTRCPEVD